MTSEKTDALLDAAMKLLSVEIDDLYAILGAQLLGQADPTRAAGIVIYMTALRRAEQAVNFIEIVKPGWSERGEWLNVIHEELKRDGIRYLADVSGELRRALCNDEILRLSDGINRSSLHIILMVVGTALKISPEFQSISVTVATIILKLGMRQFCS